MPNWKVLHSLAAKCATKMLTDEKSDFIWLLWPWELGQGQIYGMSWKALSRATIWYITAGFICKTFWMTAISIPHWFALEKWTLAHKSEVKGHSDLMLWVQVKYDPRGSHAKLEGSIFIGRKMCHQNVYRWKFRFHLAAMTLRMEPRSNIWYVLKGLVKGYNLIHNGRVYL